MKKCTLGPRHKWAFVKNIDVHRETLTLTSHNVHISKKGLYKCECGAKKHGDIR